VPSLRPSFRLLSVLAGFALKPIEAVGHEAARKQLRDGRLTLVFGKPAPMKSVEDTTIATVPVRRFVPPDARPGVIVFAHGGGWVVGDVTTHDGVCRALAQATQREVVSVEYRLAPEHRFPAAIDDVLAVTAQLATEGPVLVAGDSAGGHLAAVAARRCAASGIPLRGQLLVYPVTDNASESGSYERYASGYILTRATMRYFQASFVPDVSQRAHPDVSPLRAPPQKTAPAYVLLAEIDVLHDEGVAYAEEPRPEGPDVGVGVVPGVPPGFLSVPGPGGSRPSPPAVRVCGPFARPLVADSTQRATGPPPYALESRPNHRGPGAPGRLR